MDGNGDHFWTQHPKIPKIDQKYVMQLKIFFFQTCVINALMYVFAFKCCFLESVCFHLFAVV